MKTAFAYWDNRIAPVFDIARQIHIVETESGRITGEAIEVIANDLPAIKVLRIVDLGINTLVCGAISSQLHAMISASGIRVISFVAGDLRKIINAWLEGKLESGRYAMPGCCRRYSSSPEMKVNNKEVQLMNGRRIGGMGQGQRWGRRQGGGQSKVGGQGRGRFAGTIAPRAGGTCVCPKCGNHEPHERGVPCLQKRCPKCGTAMTRE